MLSPLNRGGPLEPRRDEEVSHSRSCCLLEVLELLSLGRPPCICFPCWEAAVFFGLLPCSRIRVWLKGLADSLPFHPGDCCFSGTKAKSSYFSAEDHILSSMGVLQPLVLFLVLLFFFFFQENNYTFLKLALTCCKCKINTFH